MKVIGVDKFRRQGTFDVLIKSNVSQGEGDALAEKYNKRSAERIYKCVADDYALYLRK